MYIESMCPHHGMSTPTAKCMGGLFMATKNYAEFHARITPEEARFLDMLRQKGKSKSEILHKAIKREMKNFPEYASKMRWEHEEKAQEWKQIEESSKIERSQEDEEKRMYMDTVMHDFEVCHRSQHSEKYNIEWLRGRYNGGLKERGLSVSDILSYCAMHGFVSSEENGDFWK